MPLVPVACITESLRGQGDDDAGLDNFPPLANRHLSVEVRRIKPVQRDFAPSREGGDWRRTRNIRTDANPFFAIFEMNINF